MEKEEKDQRECRAVQTDFVLQWGNRKRLRGGKVKKDANFINTKSADYFGKRKLNSSPLVSADKDFSSLPHRFSRNSGLPMNNGKFPLASLEKEDRYYTTRGSLGLDDNGGKVLGVDQNGHGGNERGDLVWPKLFLSLSSKEKEEDFMAMKGCKLPQRPKKRAKLLQRSLLLVMPGVWLSDLCQERYEVREKKASKKRPRGLKAMGGMNSDSD